VQIAETTLSQPGPFTLQETVCWADSPPSLDLIVWDLEGQPVTCKAGVFLSLPPVSASNVMLYLTVGSRPMRA
jgi:hypothetical protein